MRNVGLLLGCMVSALALGCASQVPDAPTSPPAAGTLMTGEDPTNAASASHLEPATRSRLQPYFDVDALDRLIASMHPQERAFLVQNLSAPDHSGLHPGSSGSHLQLPIRFSDPAQQALLEQVWAPYWEQLPAEALDSAEYLFPGRELARARRAARSAHGERPSQ